MKTYPERYRQGACIPVWQELVAQHAAIRQEPLLSAAQVVAHEVMQRVRHNLILLIERLRTLGYRFAAEHPTYDHFVVATHMPRALAQIERYGVLPPASIHILGQIWGQQARQDAMTEQQEQTIEAQFLAAYGDLLDQTPAQSTVWQSPSDLLLNDLADLERDYGPLPLVLHTWYEVVGEVSLMGDHPKLSCYYGDNQGPVSDPLVIRYGGDDLRAQADEASERSARRQQRQLYHFEIAPDACCKSNYSGGSPLCLKVPNPGFDGPLISVDGWENMFFISYLRECFAWGGFPGLKWDSSAAEAAREELTFLTKDLLPL